MNTDARRTAQSNALSEPVIPDYGQAPKQSAGKSNLLCIVPILLAAIEYFWCAAVAVAAWMFVVGDNQATWAQSLFLGGVAALPVLLGTWIGYRIFSRSSTGSQMFRVINAIGMILCCVWVIVIVLYAAR